MVFNITESIRELVKGMLLIKDPETAESIESLIFDSSDSDINLYKIKSKLILKNYTPDMNVHDAFANPHSLNTVRWKEYTDAQILMESRKNVEVSTTDMFKCTRCKESKCTYYTLQIRSADESATIFIECTICGKKWKQ